MANSESRGGTLVLKAHVAAELLRELAESRRMQIDRERAGKLELAARAGFDGVGERVLFRR